MATNGPKLSMNLFKKLMLMLLVTSILPIFLTQLITYSISASTIRRQTLELGLANLQQAGNGMKDFFKAYDRIILDVYTDESYTEALKAINLWDTRNYYTAKHEIERKLESIAFVNPDILGIAIVGVNGDATFYDTVTHSGQDSFCFDLDRLRTDEIFRNSLDTRQTLYSGTIRRTDPLYGERRYFYVSHRLIDFNGYNDGAVGSIVLCIDERAVREVYLSGMDAESNWMFLVNRKGDIVSFPAVANIGENLFAGSGASSALAGAEADAAGNGAAGVDRAGADGTSAGLDPTALAEAARRYFHRNSLLGDGQLEVHVSSVKDGEFSLVHVQNLTYALRDVQGMTVIIVLIAMLVGAICVLISLSFATGTNKRVRKIVRAMGKADAGDYGVKLQLEGNDEFAVIAHHYNDMIERIDESTRLERAALVRQKDAEIRSLEAQINPHFLCNTLDAINWVAIEREELHISRLLNHLAVILRHSIYQCNESVTIREEMEYLRRYIDLQQERFCYSFQYVADIDESLLGCRIHKLLIQPLIENTIIHGFPGRTGRDEIRVEIRREGERHVAIAVQDNGKGMPAELVDRFNHFDHDAENGQTHIGLMNVINRLMLYYGTSGGFHVESGEGGTCVTMRIPHAVQAEMDEAS